MGITFEHPGWLWLMALAAPMAWAGLRLFASMSGPRRWSAVVLRVVLIGLIAGMLAGASSVRRTDRVAVVGVVDVSGSVRLFGEGVGAATDPESARRTGAVEAARAFFAAAFSDKGGRRAEDLAGLVVFDGRALAVAVPTRGDVADRSLDVNLADGTDIAGALRYAAALIPPDAAGRLVLVSDGGENAGDAGAAARELAGRRGQREGRGGEAGSLPVDVVPIGLNAAREVMVESVDAPPRAAAESAVTVRVSLLATGEATGELALLRNGEPVDINGEAPGSSRRVSFGPGRHVELVRVELPRGMVHQFKAVWTPDAPVAGGGDTRRENNTGEAFTASPGKGSVLVVRGDGGSAGSTLSETLRRAGIDVTVLPPEAIPGNLLGFQAYDLVILENVPAEAVPEPTQAALSAHVREMGAGLIMVGGRDSFGAGGWKGSVLEPLLPVKLDLPEKLVQPDAAVVLVMDNSGSMGRRVASSVYTQQEIANQAAALAVRTLSKSDLVGVVLFNTDMEVLVPLGPNTDPKRIQERILSVAPGGGTRMGPALEEAWTQLKGAKAAVRHVIVMSDGRSMDGGDLPGLARRMKLEDGITVSTIGVGDDADERTMAAMASNTGGRFYQVTNPTLLPRFMLKAIRVVRTPLIREGQFRPVVRPTASALTAGLGDPPPLRGLVLTQRRPEPTITYAMETPTGEPLLAHWTVELGQVAAFTSDASADGWAALWVDWPGYTQVWTQAARSLARASAPERMELTTDVVGDELRLRLDAAGEDGRPLDLLTVEAKVTVPGGSQVKTTLSQTGPGVYEGAVAASQSGNYIAILTPRLGDKRLTPVLGGSSVSSGVEFRNLRANTALLERVAGDTGGRVLDLAHPEAANLFDRAGVRPREARTPLWPVLLVWAVVVLLLDVGTRRIAWDRFVSRDFGVDLAKAAAEAVAERGAAAVKAAGRLREAPRGDRLVVDEGVRLSEEDAAKLAETERERRVAARLETLRAMREAQRGQAVQSDEAAGSAVRTGPPGPRVDGEKPADPGGADLLAAKKRARERFEEQRDAE